MEGIQADILAEASRVTAASAAADLPLRLIGGVAIRLHASQLPPSLERPYQDIDLVTTGKASRRTIKLLQDLGYTPNERFNAVNAGRRAVVYDLQHQRQVDVFIGEFRMCHTIDLSSRLHIDSPTVPLAELLLTKLQIVELNRKDLVDIAALLYGHDVSDQDGDTINGERIAQLLSGDWGLWRTSRGSVETAEAHLAELGLDGGDEGRIRERLDKLWKMVEAAPKSLRWRSRARIGDRSRWYEQPEEVDHDRSGERLSGP